MYDRVKQVEMEVSLKIRSLPFMLMGHSGIYNVYAKMAMLMIRCSIRHISFRRSHRRMTRIRHCVVSVVVVVVIIIIIVVVIIVIVVVIVFIIIVNFVVVIVVSLLIGCSLDFRKSVMWSGSSLALASG